MSCKNYISSRNIEQCDSKSTVKKVLIEKVNGIITATGLAYVTIDGTKVIKNVNFQPTATTKPVSIDDTARNILNVEAKSGFEYVGYDTNGLCDSITLEFKKCVNRVINVVDEFGARLKTFTQTSTITATRPKQKVCIKLVSGTAETSQKTLDYLNTLPQFLNTNALSLTDLDVSTLEFHNVMGGREGSVIVNEKITTGAVDTKVMVNCCDANVIDLGFDMTKKDLLDKKTEKCIDGITGEITETQTFVIADKITN